LLQKRPSGNISKDFRTLPTEGEKKMINYLPYADRTPDSQYKRVLREILDLGKTSGSAHKEGSITCLAPSSMRFDLRNGFPMITERTMASEKMLIPPWQQAIGEIFAFVNGARTLKELESFGCLWWKPWGTAEKCQKRGLEPGDLGPGSYGPAFTAFPTPDGESFNQFEAIIQQIRERPSLRTHYITPWIPFYTPRIKGRTQKVVVCPCHGFMYFRVIDDKLHLVMNQRSGDVPVGVPANMIQYAALLMAMAHVTGYEPGTYVHSITDAHIYNEQIEKSEILITRESRRFPTVTLSNPPESLFDFRREHFSLTRDYHPHPGMKFPVAI
jgi:thymidylate synthase